MRAELMRVALRVWTQDPFTRHGDSCTNTCRDCGSFDDKCIWHLPALSQASSARLHELAFVDCHSLGSIEAICTYSQLRKLTMVRDMLC